MNKATFEKLKNFRRTLHQYPELSGEEKETASRVLEFFKEIHADEVLENLGGNGLAFVFEGKEQGPTTLYRCELDGLPIREDNNIKYKSTIPGKAHLCGHDGHMAIVAGLGLYLKENRPKKGRVILLFQPAEETGQGAGMVVKDNKFQKILPDFAFALHNLPGYEKNQIIIKKGAFAAASNGMIIKLKGKNAHASHPEAGNSPAEAMSKIIVALQKLPDAMKKFTMITVIHAKLGEVAFGTTPGDATVMATIRAYENETRELLVHYAEKLCEQIAKEYMLEISFEYVEEFAATHNHQEAWEYGNQAAKNLNLKTKHIRIPFRWSEDFGHFSIHTKTLLFGLGSGKSQPQLHENNYDFPDEIIPTGVNMFQQIIEQLHH
ncbi:amidohydrolase [Belliella baltica DSM 15883]|uniref:Amidohydrolase n=1 Tax=Belliella baltica (strain DSM 15883 / CIP 108006 / LMG 21964 / BA134) TaxID=866536 RepID=I3Z2J9_BELBD|nr:amidohydrolase [Belliella baltica]AFL83467.1 amidohydrolase [Belliella baltica DSM 15883]